MMQLKSMQIVTICCNMYKHVDDPLVDVGGGTWEIMYVNDMASLNVQW